MGSLRPVLGLVLALTAGVLRAHAAGIAFEAAVDRTTAAVGEPIQLTLTVSSSANLPHVPAPQIDLDDFAVEGPAVNTRVEIVNGTASFGRDLVYVLYARRAGRYTVGPARLEVQGRTYQTRAIQVDVVAGRAKPSSGAGGSGPAAAGLGDNLFLRVNAEPRRVYVGQQVALSYDLCYRVQLHNVGFKDVPSFSGFWVKDLFVAQQLQAHREVIGGLQYNVSPLRQAALFPTSPGPHRVDPLVVSCTAPVASRRGGLLDAFGLFDDPLFGRSQTVGVASDPVDVEAMPLPAQGRPPEFTGAVGRYTVQAEVQTLEVATGDPVTLSIEVTGQGNLDAVEAPNLDRLPGFKVYPPKVDTRETTDGGQYGGTRRFEYILIPERGGRLEIPAVRLAYFDPQAATYRSVLSAPFTVTCVGGAGEQAAGYAAGPAHGIGPDIRHIAPDADDLRQGPALYQSWWFWSLQGVLSLAFAGWVAYQRHQRRLQGDVAYARRRRARGEASRRLQRAEELLGEGRGTEFHAEVDRAVRAFLADHLNLPAASLAGSAAAEHLTGRGVDKGLVRDLRRLQERCEYARFAPTSPTSAEMAEVQELAERLIASLGKVI